MTDFEHQTPIVLSFNNHDPSGSSGMQADIETSFSIGCHCTPIITSLCAKDTRDIKDIIPVDSTLIIEQARAILEDMPVKAIKVGFLGTTENVQAVHDILNDYQHLPIVVDPVTHICNGRVLDEPQFIRSVKNLLLPMATIAVPDLIEAHELSTQGDTLDACAQEILETGCDHVLITGSHRDQHYYDNSLYGQQGLIKRYRQPRLKLFSHGSGATLSASISSYLAHGITPMEAINQGQHFTWQSLESSRQLGMGRSTPNRIFWSQASSYKHTSNG